MPYQDRTAVALNATAARALTDEVKADAAALWSKLLALYEGGAHTALGYSSWGDYYEVEFGHTAARGYQLLDAARVALIQPGLNEKQARGLAPVLRDEPQSVPQVWSEVLEQHGPTPTAAQVREVVKARDEPNGRMAVHYSSATDEWATPQALFDVLNAEFRFTLDVCALDQSAKCNRYFTPESDGLAQEWTGTCWMNPPYGNEIGRWVEKAAASSQAPGTTVVCLLPARVDTGWWWDNCRYAEIRFLRGRLKFGTADAGAPFPSAVVVFGHEPCVKWWEWR